MKLKSKKKAEHSRVTSAVCCEQLRNAVSDKSVPVIFVAKFREFGIQILDGGSSYIQITHCPWCRRALPKSLRSKWFAALEKLGLEPGDKKIPREYLDESWYSK